MKDEKINKVVESYLNGNFAEVKASVKVMNKADFITFIEGCRANGINPYRLRHLVE